MLQENSKTKGKHGLAFPLAIVAAIGKPFGLTIDAQEHHPLAAGYDAVFVTVLDSRCMLESAKHFHSMGIPLRRAERPVGKFPLVWAGGQGLHNPRPYGDIADLILIGDAEDALPVLLRLWDSHGNTVQFLEEAANVPGVWVPSLGLYPVTQQVASDIGISLRNDIRVSLDGSRRMEIARGCRSKCTFCSLGWRAPVRENSASDILHQVSLSGKRVHLQAGDAEGHREIATIRRELAVMGSLDQGWTGRVDSFFENPEGRVAGHKRYAFGIEGISQRLRAAVGKPNLTDEYLAQSTAEFFRRIEGDSMGKTCWHVIAGLPTERASEALDLGLVIQRINELSSGTARELEIHWQPFQPLPGTPMQWCAAGTGARKLAARIKSWERLPWCRIKQIAGRGDNTALICSALARSDERGIRIMEEYPSGELTPERACEISGATFGEISVSEELPWDFVQHHYHRETLEKAHHVMMKRLAQ